MIYFKKCILRGGKRKENEYNMKKKEDIYKNRHIESWLLENIRGYMFEFSRKEIEIKVDETKSRLVNDERRLKLIEVLKWNKY